VYAGGGNAANYGTANHIGDGNTHDANGAMGYPGAVMVRVPAAHAKA
jgi:hypothetical protein